MAYFKDIDRYGNEQLSPVPVKILHVGTSSSMSVVNASPTLRGNYDKTYINTFGAAWNGTIGQLTVPHTGYYKVKIGAEINGAMVPTSWINIFMGVNGTPNWANDGMLEQQLGRANGTYTIQGQLDKPVYLTAGTVIDTRLQASATYNTPASRPMENFFIVEFIGE